MRLIVLTYSVRGNAADAKSDALLVARARRRGCDASIVRVESLGRRRGGAAAWADAGDSVLPRADLRSIAELRAFSALARDAERCGARCSPSAEALVAAEDKAETDAHLGSANVASPLTVAPSWLPKRDRGDAASLATAVGGLPVLVKPRVGWGGMGIVRCDDLAALSAAIRCAEPAAEGTASDAASGESAASDARRRAAGPRTDFLVQSFVESRRTITVLVAGGRALSAWEQRPEPGAAPASCAADPTTAAAAVRATAACGLAFASVDFLDPIDGRPPLCIDVNSMPGLWPDDPDDVAFADAMIACALGRP